MIRTKILERYPLPVTASIVEADTRGLLKTLKPDDRQRYENIARSIFALPNVQAGSHSYTHPFSWDPADPNPGHFDRVNVQLNDSVSYPTVDLEREIKGSIDYINQNLLPKNKKVEYAQTLQTPKISDKIDKRPPTLPLSQNFNTEQHTYRKTLSDQQLSNT